MWENGSRWGIRVRQPLSALCERDEGDGMSAWTRKLSTCQHLLIREHFDARRSDVSQTGLVQANGEVRRPANAPRNKVMICRKKGGRKRGSFVTTSASRMKKRKRETHGGCEERGEAGEERRWRTQVGTCLGVQSRTPRRRGSGSSGRC